MRSWFKRFMRRPEMKMTDADIDTQLSDSDLEEDFFARGRDQKEVAKMIQKEAAKDAPGSMKDLMRGTRDVEGFHGAEGGDVRELVSDTENTDQDLYDNDMERTWFAKGESMDTVNTLRNAWESGNHTLVGVEGSLKVKYHFAETQATVLQQKLKALEIAKATPAEIQSVQEELKDATTLMKALAPSEARPVPKIDQKDDWLNDAEPDKSPERAA